MLTVGSLFAGIGGFDLGLERTGGFRVVWQVENDPYCNRVLAKHWPHVKRYGDITIEWGTIHESIDVICGGDPCPVRSLARGHRPTRHPDLSGYFLLLVGRLRPRWVLRENVPAPDVMAFAAALAALGYGVVALALDARDFTAQSRRRQFVIGCPPSLRSRFTSTLLDASNGEGFSASSPEEETPIAACLTARPARIAAEDSYCYEPGKGLRLLACEEAERLQGFPGGWTAGFSRSRRRRMTGNAVVPQVVEWIGRRILEVA